MLKNGILTKEDAEILKTQLVQKLQDAKNDLEFTDSPLFQLISEFLGIQLPHEVTESFRDRARIIFGIHNELKDARRMQDKNKAPEKIKAIEASLGEFNEAHSEILVDLILSYRDVEGWEEMISLVDRLPDNQLSNAITIREQYAFALNRRNNPGDREHAIDILQEIIDKHGLSPETCGLYGRIYKDLYEESQEEGNKGKAGAYLDEAIVWYRNGFESDPRDYYPGINVATLLYVKGDERAMQELRQLLPAVSFAVVRRGGIQSQDYWDVATVLEIAALSEDWENALRAAQRLIILKAPDWNLKSTVKNLHIIRNVRTERGLTNKELDNIMKDLEKRY